MTTQDHRADEAGRLRTAYALGLIGGIAPLVFGLAYLGTLAWDLGNQVFSALTAFVFTMPLWVVLSIVALVKGVRVRRTSPSRAASGAVVVAVLALIVCCLLMVIGFPAAMLLVALLLLSI